MEKIEWLKIGMTEDEIGQSKRNGEERQADIGKDNWTHGRERMEQERVGGQQRNRR